jgi:phosphoribosylaminoimidazolecarboxamide formyltransferase/IMP cyclohydrolase
MSNTRLQAEMVADGGASKSPKITRAVISVSDKTGIVEFAQALSLAGVELFSTGGTRRVLSEAGLEVHDIASYTGFPEVMDGRVKTLHPKIFGGILARLDNDSDLETISELEISPFELVVVNLYPFSETIARPNVTEAECVEQIDIGGPSLVRAASKNHKFITVVTDQSQFEKVALEIESHGCTCMATRRQLMVEAFAHTADYDTTIANHFAASSLEPNDDLPQQLRMSLRRQDQLRYGENSHQKAAVYTEGTPAASTVVGANQLNGKQLSYNNLLDLDAALAIVQIHDQPACSVIKHNNPCGAASAETLAKACEKGFAGDPTSAFGSVVGFNRKVDLETATWLGTTPNLFVEAIVAPGFESDALEILKTKPKWKKNVRLIDVGEMRERATELAVRSISGGWLVQESDSLAVESENWKVATETSIDDSLMSELKFGWAVIRFVKSNAIALSKDCSLVGVGAGQMSRVDSVRIAIEKAGDRAAGSVLSSDAFFPFADSIELAAAAGIRAIIQPGGSVRDEEVIAACNQHGIPMVLAGQRHFRH